MRLVEHVSGVELRRAALRGVDEFVEDEVEAERVDGAGVEIVVAVFGIVEVEAGELAGADQARDDLLDIDVRRVVAEIDETARLGP